MMRGFYNGVSGIKTQSFGMDVWSNNISNINNVGFKASIPEFKNLINQNLVSAGSGPTSDQVGLGATKQTTALDMSNGSFQSTDNNFDLAIGGDGFFGVVDKTGKNYYTRTGTFDIDAAGNQVPNGSYTISATYTGKDGKEYKTQIGNYPVEAVKFVDGKAMMKVAGEYVSMDKVSEYYEG